MSSKILKFVVLFVLVIVAGTRGAQYISSVQAADFASSSSSLHDDSAPAIIPFDPPSPKKYECVGTNYPNGGDNYDFTLITFYYDPPWPRDAAEKDCEALCKNKSFKFCGLGLPGYWGPLPVWPLSQ